MTTPTAMTPTAMTPANDDETGGAIIGGYSNIGLALLDWQYGAIIFINQAGADLLGCTIQDVIGLQASDLFVHRRDFRTLWRSVVHSGSATAADVCLCNARNTPISATMFLKSHNDSLIVAEAVPMAPSKPIAKEDHEGHDQTWRQERRSTALNPSQFHPYALIPAIYERTFRRRLRLA